MAVFLPIPESALPLAFLPTQAQMRKPTLAQKRKDTQAHVRKLGKARIRFPAFEESRQCGFQ
ncbi:hypothetical protein [Pseudomonas aeruginosa]|uniref:hypothetical protein n=1 Tax=Pseudomonas aeruginosa TaxID=287 RepID=UPI0011156FA5|nr:hypothetical protein [Pseudomonas aeruginosa]